MKIGAFKRLYLILLILLILFVTFILPSCSNETINEEDISTSCELADSFNPDDFKNSENFEEETAEQETIEKLPVRLTQDSPMPSIYIDIDPDDILYDEWTRGITVSLRNAGKREFEFENIITRIRGRGNASWWAMGEKRPIRLRIESPRAMFGTEYIARDWVLLANVIDYSHMRNVGALYLGALLGRFEFNPIPAIFVHVYLNGDYRGVYQFTDQIQVRRFPGTGRVEADFHPEPELSEYFIEWCRHGRKPEDISIEADGIPFLVHYPDAGEITGEHVKFISGFVGEVSYAIRNGVFGEVAALIDIPTFVDFYLVNEFTKNADVFFSSVFFTAKLEENGRHRLYAGPLWDFDQSAGGTSDTFYPDHSPQGAWTATENEWFRRLMRIPEFKKAVSDRWFEIRDAEVAETLAEIRYLSTTYRDDFERNFKRWPNLLGKYSWRTPPEMQAIKTYEGQVDYLLDWYEQRIIWMDEFLK